jgi:hypothetical protein
VWVPRVSYTIYEDPQWITDSRNLHSHPCYLGLWRWGTELALNAPDPRAVPAERRRRQEWDQIGRRALAEELCLQRAEIQQGLPRRMAATLPASIVAGTQASDAATPTQLQMDLAKGGARL